MQYGGRNLAFITCKFYPNNFLKFETKFLLDVVSGRITYTIKRYFIGLKIEYNGRKMASSQELWFLNIFCNY